MQSVLLFFAFYYACIILSILVWFQLKNFNSFNFFLRDFFKRFFKILVSFCLLLFYNKFQSSTMSVIGQKFSVVDGGGGVESNFSVYLWSSIAKLGPACKMDNGVALFSK